ncbi:hypothetical protein Hanom_Chr11g01044091 [Helianthus anomalus]
MDVYPPYLPCNPPYLPCKRTSKSFKLDFNNDNASSTLPSFHTSLSNQIINNLYRSI